MAFLLGCEKASVSYPSKTVLDGVSVGVDAGSRIGIVGRNGDGKSTLIEMLAGRREPDAGRVIATNGASVGLLAQTDDLDNEASVQTAVVGRAPEYEWAGDARIRAIMQGLIGDIPLDQRVGSLSGGQRRRVDLARLLVGTWDALLLDEPTNHLDVRAINWLANHLKNRWRPGEGALLVVTHDRWFLDEVCTSMWEVHDGRIEPFEGGFSAYIMQRVERERVARVTEERRQNKLRRELAWLSRGARARSTKPKFHVKAAQELIADVPPLRNELELKRMAVARLGKQCVDLENVSVSFDGRAVLRDVTWLIGPGDRVGIVGANGAGKTTLLNVIQGRLSPTRGRVKIGKTVRFAFLSQHLDNLAALGDDRVRQVAGRYSSRVMLDGLEQTPGDLLERLGFSKADLNEPVRDLSGGQKRRLALMLILLDQPNVLILDEPGNDLDVDMLAAVEDLLDGWPGTLILVTHDRYLMERVTDDQYAVIDGAVRHLPGGIDEYLRLADERDRARSSEAAQAHKPKGAARGAGAGSPGLSNAEQRVLKKELASTERKMRTAERKVTEAKAAMLDIDPTDFVALGQAQKEVDALQAQFEALEEAWLDVAERLGE